MTDYADTARDALDSLADVGALVLVEWDAPQADYDPAAPDTVPALVQVRTYGAMVPYPAHKVGTQPDSLIRAGDRNLLLAALDPAGVALPEIPPGATVTDAAGGKWRVANAEPIAPAGVTVLFDITVRR